MSWVNVSWISHMGDLTQSESIHGTKHPNAMCKFHVWFLNLQKVIQICPAVFILCFPGLTSAYNTVMLQAGFCPISFEQLGSERINILK